MANEPILQQKNEGILEGARYSPNGPYFLDLNATGHGPLTIDVHIDLESLFGVGGILSGTFNDLDGSGQGTDTNADAGNGLRGVVQIRVTPKTRNPFTIKALPISGVT